MIQTLHAERVESWNGKVLDLELLLNQVRGIFKPNEDGLEEDITLQTALSAQVRKTNYENRGAVLQECPIPNRIATQGTNCQNPWSVTSSTNLSWT